MEKSRSPRNSEFRFFISEELIGEVFLKESELHHLAHVLRYHVGDSVSVVNGRGSLAKGEITHISKREACVRVLEVHTEPYPKRQVILAQGLPKLKRLEMIVEKGTELGMTHLWLFQGERGEKGPLSASQKGRLAQIMVSALKQCGRLYLPEIVFLPPIKSWKPFAIPCYFGSLNPEAPWLQEVTDGKHAILVIGPESGFSEEEEKGLVSCGAVGVKLHENILRTETAAIAGMTLLSLS